MIAAVGALMAPPGAHAAIAPRIPLGSNRALAPTVPGIAVDTGGDAYVAWQVPGNPSTHMDFCKVSTTSTGCHPIALPAPDQGATFSDPPSVFVSGQEVLVFEQVSGGSDNDAIGMDEWVSTDGGASFEINPDAVSYITGLSASPDESPVIALPDRLLGFGYAATDSNPLFQTNALVSPASYSAAATAAPPFATIGAPSSSYTLTDQTAQFASQLTGSLGVLGVFTAYPGTAFGPCPSSAPGALAYAYASISAPASPTQVQTELHTSPGTTGSAWSTLAEVDCDGANPAVGGGPSGLGLLETNTNSDLDELVQYRAFKPPSTWSEAVTIGTGQSADGSVSQDSAGGIYATWLDPVGGVELAYSSTRGATWRGPVVLASASAASLGSLVSAVNGSGVGWAAYSANGVEYAQPFSGGYTFAAPVNASRPTVSGTAAKGGTLSCAPGAWLESPTRYTYGWYRNGALLAGAGRSTYRVGTLDEGSSIGCAVTASNPGGSATVRSRTEPIAVKVTSGCPAATGKMTGSHIGLLRLGMTRSQARSAYRGHTVRRSKYGDLFCLTPAGVRAGYVRRPANRAVWASTGDPYYALDGVRVGESIATASAALHTEAPFGLGKDEWYVAVKHGYTAVLMAHGGAVEELAIAASSATRTRASQRALIRSVS